MKDNFEILNDVKMNIDEYEELEFKDNEDLKKKMKSKIRDRKINNRNQFLKVSTIVVIGTISLYAINPEIVRAIPVIGSVIENFDSSNFGKPVEKYVKYSKDLELVAEDKGATVLLKDVLVDDNMFMIGLVVESDVLSGFEGKNQHDFINIDTDVLINGEGPDSIWTMGKKIDDRTGAVIVSGNVAELNLGEYIKLDISVNYINGNKKELNGNWNFKVNIEKSTESKRIPINKGYDIKGQKLVLNEIVTSPIASTLILSGIDDTKNYTLQSTKFKILDDRGNILKSKELSSSVYNKTGEFNGKIQIDSDLSNTKYINLIPYWGLDTIHKEKDGIYLDLLTTTGEGEREEIIISRKPTKGELHSGYALDNVYYYINIDKNREFLSIDDLIGYEIDVNNKDKVIIKDIDVDDKNTKITMQVKGNYNYLSQLVLFDEEMNDIAAWEGHIGAVLEDEKENIYSITLDRIDISKKYKIAIPQTKDIDLDSKYKIKVDLKK